VHHRGTTERPGMVLGLDRGGACEGIAYRVSGANAAQTTRYLRAREQVNGVYRETHVPVELIKGPHREVLALAYIVERAHPNYAGQLPLAVQARLIHGAQGRSGANLDYLISTLRHLAELGIRERELERLLAVIGPHSARFAGCEKASPHAAAMVRMARSRPPARRAKLPKGDRRFLYRLQLGV
jgi:cation transport protein ChaC